jgi:Flp pilus assembly protein TadG
VLLTPLLILFVLFLVGLGRLAHARALVGDAAAQAARAATLQYLSPGQAAAAGQQTATEALAGVACASQNTTVDSGNDRPGGTITVTLSCRVDLSAVTAAGFPGSTTLTATFTAPVDTYVPQPLGIGFCEVPVDGNRSPGDR